MPSGSQLVTQTLAIVFALFDGTCLAHAFVFPTDRGVAGFIAADDTWSFGRCCLGFCLAVPAFRFRRTGFRFAVFVGRRFAFGDNLLLGFAGWLQDDCWRRRCYRRVLD